MMHPFQKSSKCSILNKRKIHKFGLHVLLGVTSVMLAALPTKAAEKVYFSYGLLERSISVESLEDYAEDGTVNADLRFFLGFLNSNVRSEFRTVLQNSYQISPVIVAQSFYEPMGERALGYVGNLIQTGKRQNGLYALRSALILAAAQPEGFTLIDVLRQFPTEGMRVDLQVLLSILRQGEAFFQNTNAVIAGIEELAQKTESPETSIGAADIPDLRQPGNFQFSKQTLTIEDASRNRTYPVDLYLPYSSTSSPIPVVILSHGLGSRPADFADIAEHFASYGFAVALPEHIGSNFALQRAVLAGQASEVFRVSEFVDRPLDVSFLLDELERLNHTSFQGRLNLQRVAALGHSFGGYTVLALGGATADFENLAQVCQDGRFLSFLDPALLLQCRALEASSEAKARLTQGLKDDRISLVVAFNPVNAGIFGPEGLGKLQIPVVIGASGYDPAAPLVPEQAFSFTWLTTPERYLLLARGGAHIPQLTAIVNRILSPSIDSEQLQEEVELFRSNAKALMLAFLQVYLADRSEYERYLQPFNVRTLGDPPFDFSLIRSLTKEQLSQMLD
jgi:predicted dienelactone hydrolase